MKIWVIVWAGGYDEPDVQVFTERHRTAEHYDRFVGDVKADDFFYIYEADADKGYPNEISFAGLNIRRVDREYLDEDDQETIFER